MAIEEVLDRKLDSLFQKDLSKKNVLQLLGSYKTDYNSVKFIINEFCKDLNKDQKTYCLLNIENYLRPIELHKDHDVPFGGYYKINFYKNKQLLIDDLHLQLEDLNYKLDTEIFTDEEFLSFKNELSNIAKSIFEFKQRQESANELIFNSVEEIKDQLFKDAEKAKIFGKEFVIQQAAGKVMDMTMKAGATAFLSHVPEHFSKIQKFLGTII